MNRTNILHIIRREYLVRVKNRSFLIMTFLAPFILILFGGVVAFLISGSLNDENIVYVWDQTQEIEPHLKSSSQVTFKHADPALSLEEVKKSIDFEEQNFLVIIDPEGSYSLDSLENNIALYGVNPPGLIMTEEIQSQVEEQIMKMKLAKKGVDFNVVEAAKSKVKLKIINDEKENISMEADVARGVSFLSFFMMYLFVFAYGARVMRSVMEEKTNRVVEVMLSSVKPRELMMGKIFGNTLVSFTQFVIWLIMASLAMMVAQQIIGGPAPMENMPNAGTSASNFIELQEILKSIMNLNLGTIVFSFFFYFLFGFLTYSALFAAIGALVDNQQDAQQFMIPIVIPMMLTLYASFGIVENPNSSMAQWLSILPFTSSISMMARVPFGVPIWELILSMVLLVLFFALVVTFSAKLYRVGILVSRSKPSYKDIWKWMKDA